MIGEGNDVKVKGVVQLDDAAFQDQFEEWRDAIYAYVLEQGQPIELSELGFKVKRPPVLKSVGLQDLLRLDPRNRFSLHGCVNHVRAGLRTGWSYAASFAKMPAPVSEHSPVQCMSKTFLMPPPGFGCEVKPYPTMSPPPRGPVLSGVGGGLFNSYQFMETPSPPPPPFSPAVGSHLLSPFIAPIAPHTARPGTSLGWSAPAVSTQGSRPASTPLRDWLGAVFRGLPMQSDAALFAERLRNEVGLETVQDLLDAHRTGRVTPELMQYKIGISAGYYNLIERELIASGRQGAVCRP